MGTKLTQTSQFLTIKYIRFLIIQLISKMYQLNLKFMPYKQRLHVQIHLMIISLKVNGSTVQRVYRFLCILFMPFQLMLLCMLHGILS